MTGFTCAIVLLTQGSHPWHNALLRIIETLLGIVVAVVVSSMPKLLPPDKPTAAIREPQEPVAEKVSK